MSEYYEGIKKDIDTRLNRIIGQTNGLKRMIEDERSCKEVLDQIYAIRMAFDSLSKLIFENYIRNRLGELTELSRNDEIFKILNVLKRG